MGAARNGECELSCPDGANVSNLREKNLRAHLNVILDIIPEKDVHLEGLEFSRAFFMVGQTSDPPSPVNLVFMQLAKFEYHFNNAARDAVRRMLCDFDYELPHSMRVFASDLIDIAPIKASKKNTTMARDVLIIMALLILRELGHNPTKNEATDSEKRSGAEIIFEHLRSKRDLRFSENAKNIEGIWSDRYKRLEKLGLSELLFDQN